MRKWWKRREDQCNKNRVFNKQKLIRQYLAKLTITKKKNELKSVKYDRNSKNSCDGA